MDYSKIIVEHFRNILKIHPEDSIKLANIYEIYHYENNHGKYDEFGIPKCLNKMIWESECPVCKDVTIWCDDIIFTGGATIFHCLMCSYEKKPPDTNPNRPDRNIPVQPIKPMGNVK